MTALTRGRVISLSDQEARPGLRKSREPAALGRVPAEGAVDVVRLRSEIREEVRAELAFEQTQKLLELATLRASILERAHNDIIQIARLLAERVIAEELALDPSRLVEMARQALREAGGAEQVTIHAAPEAAELLRHEIDRLESSRVMRIEIVPDASLGPGDLRVQTDIGSIDARVGTQLTHLASTVFESTRS